MLPLLTLLCAAAPADAPAPAPAPKDASDHANMDALAHAASPALDAAPAHTVTSCMATPVHAATAALPPLTHTLPSRSSSSSAVVSATLLAVALATVPTRVNCR